MHNCKIQQTTHYLTTNYTLFDNRMQAIGYSTGHETLIHHIQPYTTSYNYYGLQNNNVSGKER